MVVYSAAYTSLHQIFLKFTFFSLYREVILSFALSYFYKDTMSSQTLSRIDSTNYHKYATERCRGERYDFNGTVLGQ